MADVKKKNVKNSKTTKQYKNSKSKENPKLESTTHQTTKLKNPYIPSTPSSLYIPTHPNFS
jgi:hypothetical protein